MKKIPISSLSGSQSSPVLSSAGFRNSISATNELSTGLTVGMTNSVFLNSYQGAVTTQVKALNDTLVLGQNFQLGATKINNFVEGSIAPISGVLAGIGLTTVNTDKLYEAGSIGELTFTKAQTVSGICLDIIQGQQRIFTNTLPKIQNSEMFQLVSDSAISTQIISSGVNTILHSLPTYPTEIKLPNLETVYKVGKVTKKEISNHQIKLDKMLIKISPSLVEYRNGCWETFNKKGKDYIGQSSSSMRRLVDELLRMLAPTEKVKGTKFFKESKEAKDDKGNPTKKARVYHIVKFDQKGAKHLERLAKGLFEAYGNLSAWDHKPHKQEDFVYGVFITIEGYLYSLLSESK